MQDNNKARQVNSGGGQEASNERREYSSWRLYTVEFVLSGYLLVLLIRHLYGPLGPHYFTYLRSLENLSMWIWDVSGIRFQVVLLPGCLSIGKNEWIMLTLSHCIAAIPAVALQSMTLRCLISVLFPGYRRSMKVSGTELFAGSLAILWIGGMIGPYYSDQLWIGANHLFFPSWIGSILFG